VLADCDEETAAQMVREKFPFAPRNISVTVTDVIPGNDVEAVIEKDIPQSHIAMMFETGCHSGDPMMPALLMGNGIFGSLPVSLLFQKVREELGLCYSIDSRVMPFDGIIRVSAAGRKEAIEEIRREVCLQLERMQAGDFEEDLLEAARMMTIHSVRSAQDIPDALLMAYYRRALVPKTPNLNVLSDMYRRVTARDIQTCFQRLKLRTVAIVRQGDTYAEERAVP
jgi:predicted Zn-dependent peptidase